jgi:hypothetical protein
MMQSLLAQESLSSVSTTAQLQYFIDVLLTPTGIAAAVLGAGGVVLALVIGKGMPIFTGASLFCLTTMLHSQSLTSNILVGPLQSLRNVARPLSVALLIAAILPALAAPKGNRAHPVGGIAAWFFVFQVFYALQLFVFIDPAKGLLGAISIAGMFLVCAVGLGRRMQDLGSVQGCLKIFAWVGFAFMAANMVQLMISPGNAIVAGRLAGVAGNAQQMGTVCSFLILINVYLYNDLPPTRLFKWACLATAGILGMMLVWTGSRTNLLTTTVGITLMYRLQLGRFALLAIGGGLVLVAAISLFQDSTAGFDRILTAGNTRADVWQLALESFYSSPIIGIMPFGVDAAVESSYITALANTGLIGACLLLLPFSLLAVAAFRAWRLRPVRPDLARLCDFFIGMAGAIIVVNAFEGFAVGVLTFPVMAMYTVFAIGGFLNEEAALPAADGVRWEPRETSEAWA